MSSEEGNRDDKYRPETFHQRVIPASGFLAAFLFAVLVFLLRNPNLIVNTASQTFLTFIKPYNPVSFSDTLFAVVGIMSALFALTCVVSIRFLSATGFKNQATQRVVYNFLDWSLLLVYIGVVFSAIGTLLTFSVKVGEISIGAFVLISLLWVTHFSLFHSRNGLTLKST